MNQLGELGYHIWDIEFGDHSTALEREQNALLISGYLEANIGQLNILINTDFYLDTIQDAVAPKLEYEEKAILTQLYLRDHMQKQARNVLRGASTSTASTTTNTEGMTDWTEIREGDSVIKRSIATSTTKNTSAKLFQDSSSEAAERLKNLVHSYNMYGSKPLQVNVSDHGDCKHTDVNEEAEALVMQLQAYVDQQNSENIDEILRQVNLLIGSSEITGYAKTIPIPQGAETLFVDWSEEFKPKESPTVLATIRSLSQDDPLIVYSIEGAPSLNGVRIAFSSKIPNNRYSIEVAAFEIGSVNVSN